jgi:hypothetical protein
MRLAEACGVWGSKTAHKRLTCWFAYVLVVSWQYRRLVTVRMLYLMFVLSGWLCKSFGGSVPAMPAA